MNSEIQQNYFQWLEQETETSWWHDSADPSEIEWAFENNAIGITTNPVLVATTIANNPEFWKEKIGDISQGLSSTEKAELILKTVVQYAAKIMKPMHEDSNGERGWVCAQINPAIITSREAMIRAAKKYAEWSPNVTVKFPATSAGLDALEECVAEGITITATVSHSVAQVIEIAERHKRGIARAEKLGKKAGACFAVIMIGRIDDYLRDIVLDNGLDVSESDIIQAGIAITKRAHTIFNEKGYETKLLVAALRGVHHMTELAGGDLLMSIHPKYQKMLLADNIERKLNIDNQVSAEVITRLEAIPEFIKAYEPDGMKLEDFISFGLAQRTLTQFSVAGWQKIECACFNNNDKSITL